VSKTSEAYDEQGELIGQITVPEREIDARLLWLLRRAGEEWGPLGVALAAARLTDPAAVVSGLTVAPTGLPEPEPADVTARVVP
jgi:hypothetical protein